MIRYAFLLLTFALCGVASAQSGPIDLQEVTSVATIEQVGTLNLATIAQTASSVTLAQAGASNKAQIEQVGSGNHRVTLRQNGGSLATALQMGEGNALDGLDGRGSTAIQREGSLLFLLQDGSENVARVHQSAGAYADLTQIGTGNTITAMQTR